MNKTEIKSKYKVGDWVFYYDLKHKKIYRLKIVAIEKSQYYNRHIYTGAYKNWHSVFYSHEVHKNKKIIIQKAIRVKQKEIKLLEESYE
jgi:hypothetical protein